MTNLRKQHSGNAGRQAGRQTREAGRKTTSRLPSPNNRASPRYTGGAGIGIGIAIIAILAILANTRTTQKKAKNKIKQKTDSPRKSRRRKKKKRSPSASSSNRTTKISTQHDRAHQAYSMDVRSIDRSKRTCQIASRSYRTHVSAKSLLLP